MTRNDHSVPCPQCGQIVIAPDGLVAEGGVETAALKVCTCLAAIRWRELKRFKEKAADIIGEGACDNGFRGPVHAAAQELIMHAAECVIACRADAVVLKISNTDSVKIQYDTKGVLKCTRKEVREQKT